MNMRGMRRRTTLPIVIAALAIGCAGGGGFAIGCGLGESTLQVESVQVGKSLNSDNSVAVHTTRFEPGDTMHAAVITEGRGSATIAARWTYLGRVVNETEQKVSYNDHAATEFHIQNSGGFPVGDYKLEIFLNGEPIETRNLRVEQ
jgi:hypothetical protein